MKNKTAFKLKKIPYFKKGTLVFLESGHKLHLSDRYYRCTKKAQNICSANEKRILQKTLETAFSRYASGLHLKKENSGKYFKQLLKDNLFDLFDDTMFDMDDTDDRIENTTLLIREDLEKKKIMQESDFKELEELHKKQCDNQKPLWLLGYAFGMLKVLVNPNGKADIGRNLAQLTRHIYLSNDGKIKEIEFEPWGWYILSEMVERWESGFVNQLLKNKIKVRNTLDTELKELGITEATKQFSNIKRPLGKNFMEGDSIISMLHGVVKMLLSNGEEQKIVMFELMDKLKNDPVFVLSAQTLSVANIKLKK